MGLHIALGNKAVQRYYYSATCAGIKVGALDNNLLNNNKSGIPTAAASPEQH